MIEPEFLRHLEGIRIGMLDREMQTKASHVQYFMTDVLQKIPCLISALRDEHDWVREAAAGALTWIGSAAASAVPSLIESLSDEQASVRRAATHALRSIGPAARAATPHLVRIIALSPDSLYDAATSLVAIDSANAERHLLKQINTLDLLQRTSNSRRRLLESLRMAKPSKTSVPTLLTTLTDSHKDNRRLSAELLGMIGLDAIDATPALIAALKDKHDSVVIAVANALGLIGQTAAVRPLTHGLNHKTSDVRWAVAQALELLGPAEATPALILALQDDDDRVREAAASALGSASPTPDIMHHLTHALKHPSHPVRSAAASLVHIGTPAAADALISALNDPDARVRHATADALTSSKHVFISVLHELQIGIRHKDPDIELTISETKHKMIYNLHRETYLFDAYAQSYLKHLKLFHLCIRLYAEGINSLGGACDYLSRHYNSEMRSSGLPMSKPSFAPNLKQLEPVFSKLFGREFKMFTVSNWNGAEPQSYQFSDDALQAADWVLKFLSRQDDLRRDWFGFRRQLVDDKN
ncbi:HEAT repeat domain-containing protein [Paludisphaera borealis]|nr:HEAT repeat domain-containing protein [Paludisphaera borealis]